MDCTVCPELGLDEWGKEILARLGGQRCPLGVTLEITERCNLACVHCFINQAAGNGEALSRELATDEVKAVLDQMADAGCLSLLLTGGEPLLRPDFAEIYRHAKQAGMLVTLFTNGTLLTPRIADLLAEWPPRMIEISLYGHSQETYERVTVVPGSHGRCRQGIELLLDRGLRLGLKSVVLTANRHELAQMRGLADQLGVEFRYDPMLWPRLDGGQQPLVHRLSPEEVVALERQDAERWDRWLQADAALSERLVRRELVYSCGAGLRGCHVDSTGRLSPCMMSRNPAYDLRRMSFREAWDRLGAVRLAKRTLDTPCRTCTAGILCIQCPGWSQLAHGDNETPVEYVCEVGRLRAAQISSLNH
jgi:radical SAM protein with 4Fe4S-binding SPASM domain